MMSPASSADTARPETLGPAAGPGFWSPHSWWGQRFELVRGGAKGNLVPMEGLRGIAVFLVFLVHYFTLMEVRLAAGGHNVAPLEAVRSIGHTGVDLFFVLSGYLIYGTLISREQAFLPFMGRRVRRIYPAFLAVFAIYFVLSLVMPSIGRLPQAAGDAAVYVLQNLLLLPGLWPTEPLITVAWSLSYEMFFYLVTPLIIAALGLRRRSPELRMALLALLAVALFAYCAAYAGHVRLSMFIAGALLFEAMRRWPHASVAPGWAALAVVAGLAAAVLKADGSAAYALRTLALFAAFGLLCSAAFGRPSSWLARGLSWTPLRWLGNMSYSYYLIHSLAISASFMVAGRLFGNAAVAWPPALGLMAVAFVLTLIPSALLFLLIERPYSLSKH